MIIEFDDYHQELYEQVISLLQLQSNIEINNITIKPSIILPGLDIYPETRKIVCGSTSLNLTAKEFDIFSLLALNKNQTLTYETIYQKVWHEDSLGYERNSIRCHIRDLKKKIKDVLPQQEFNIMCVRDTGYCLKVFKNNS